MDFAFLSFFLYMQSFFNFIKRTERKRVTIRAFTITGKIWLKYSPTKFVACCNKLCSSYLVKTKFYYTYVQIKNDDKHYDFYFAIFFPLTVVS